MRNANHSSVTLRLLFTALSLMTLPALLSAACSAAPAPETFTSDSRVLSGSAESLQPLLDEAAAIVPAPGVGIAVALIDEDGAHLGVAGNPSFDETTLYEFGSITKVMTANVLAQLADEGVVALDDSVNRFLPAERQGPQWETVTLADLATHSAGLPRLPDNLSPWTMILRGGLDDPYASYDTAALYDGLSGVELGEVGGSSDYSNLGAGWLGTILTQQTELTYGELLRERLFAPLGMTTATADNGWASDSIAPPLDDNGREVANWTFDALAGAGAARGSLADAAAFLRASMAACDGDDPVARANCLAQQPTGHQFSDGTEMGLGWLRTTGPGGTAVWHNGGTGGYRTFLGFNPETGVGVVLLSNSGGLDAVDSVGLEHLIGEP